MAEQTLVTEVLVIGSGPGGYSAAFRAADLGKEVILVERYENIGGVCLNVGCIPSKALLHAAKVVDETAEMAEHGIKFTKPKIDAKKLVAWKDSIVKKLTGGLKMMAKQREVQVVQGTGKFIGDHEVEVTHEGQATKIRFQQAIIAVGSRVVELPFIPEDNRIFDSTGALTLPKVDGELLILGGGIIGMEMATVYSSLGAKVTVVEMADMIIPGADKDITKPLFKRMSDKLSFLLETKVTKVEAKKDGIHVTFEGKHAPSGDQKFDQVLVAVGRRPNGDLIDAEKAGVTVDERGFIAVDKQMRTNVPHIFAIGDVVGNPMLAHKAIPEGRLAAEVIAGKKHFFDAKVIPSVAYTDPEIAWVGVTEAEAKAQGINYDKGVFPWAASGRSLANGRDEGVTKMLFNKDTNQVIGAGIVGTNAGDLIGEVTLAIEMGCDAEDIALTIHPHPTLSETVAAATEAFEGTITDLYLPKQQKAKKALKDKAKA